MIYSNIVLITIGLRILLARVHGFIDDLKGDTMNSLKTKLVASVTMLAVAAIMLTSASFAWYTVSTQGDVARVNVQLEAHDSLEIAAKATEPGEIKVGDAGDQTTWGGTVAFMGENVFATLSQLATYNNGFKTADYDLDGRIKDDLVAVETQLTAPTYTATGATPAKLGRAGATEACVATYDFWVRTNVETATSVKVVNNGSQFIGKPASMKVVFTDASGAKLGEWSRAVGDNNSAVTAGDITVPVAAGTGDNANYKVAHVFVNVYADGNQVNADSVDSTAPDNLPKFVGHITVTK